MSCPEESQLDVPPAWLLRQASPSPKSRDGSKSDFELSNVPRGRRKPTPHFGLSLHEKANLHGEADSQAPCMAKPTSDNFIGKEVYVLRTGGSWSPGILTDIQEDTVTVSCKDGGSKRIPIHLMGSQIKPMHGRSSIPSPHSSAKRELEGSASPQPPSTSDKWSMHLPVSVLRTNGSWSQGIITDLQQDFMLVVLNEGGEKKIPAHLMDSQVKVVPKERADVSSACSEVAEERFGFKIGDGVKWTGADVDIPPGTTGYVRGFKDAFVTVQFPKGTWDLLPFGLLHNL